VEFLGLRAWSFHREISIQTFAIFRRKGPLSVEKDLTEFAMGKPFILSLIAIIRPVLDKRKEIEQAVRLQGPPKNIQPLNTVVFQRCVMICHCEVLHF
jgi:hypothetical protein